MNQMNELNNQQEGEEESSLVPFFWARMIQLLPSTRHLFLQGNQ